MDQHIIDNIKKLDEPGRRKFKQLCKKLGYEYFEPSNDKLAYDCGFIYNGNKYIVELKDRSLKYEKYDDLILEKDKCIRLLKWKNITNSKAAYYVNFFGDLCYIFNIQHSILDRPTTEKWMNALTAASTQVKTKKEVYLLNKKDAKLFTI